MAPDRKLRVILVDDEPPALVRSRGAVLAAAGFDIIGEATNGPDALALVQGLLPDIAIVDIEMPGMSGIELVRRIDPKAMPVVIFATAFDQHALQAFDVGVADFVLKPIDYERMRSALSRARTICAGDQRAQTTESLLRQVEALRVRLGEEGTPYLRDLWVQWRSEFVRLEITDIEWLQAERDYVRVFTRDGSYLLRDTLSNLETRLDPTGFARIHRSYLINLVRPWTIQRTIRGGLAARMSNGTVIPVGRSYQKSLRKRLALPHT